MSWYYSSCSLNIALQYPFNTHIQNSCNNNASSNIQNIRYNIAYLLNQPTSQQPTTPHTHKLTKKKVETFTLCVYNIWGSNCSRMCVCAWVRSTSWIDAVRKIVNECLCAVCTVCTCVCALTMPVSYPHSIHSRQRRQQFWGATHSAAAIIAELNTLLKLHNARITLHFQTNRVRNHCRRAFCWRSYVRLRTCVCARTSWEVWKRLNRNGEFAARMPHD